jgi:hypothetical protein
MVSWRRPRSRAVPLARVAAHPDLDLVFDEAWYLSRHPDVLNSGLDGLAHLLTSGAFEGRSPSPFVDLRFYADVLPADRRDGLRAFLHLLDEGVARGLPTSPFVDLDWFARRHGLTDATGTGRLRALVRRARVERLDVSPFMDLGWYGTRHAEIHLGGLDPFEYFLSVGRWLQRFPHPLWDEQRYLALNDYVRTAVGSGKYASGYEHFCAVGWQEAARDAIALPVLVDGTEDEYAEHRYLAANPDVAELIVRGEVRSGVEHLFLRGHREVATGARPLKLPSPASTATLEPMGAVPSGDLLVLLNHFDVDGRIDPHVTIAVDAYRAAGADVALITLDTSDEELAGLRDRITHVVRKSRNDDLRDFGGWDHALRLLSSDLGAEHLSRYARVILANDSAYFPVRDPEPFFAALRASEAAIFAPTDSVSGGRYHLQSYFLALAPEAVTVLAPELERRVLEQAEATKLTLIQRFEVGLSEFAIEHGLSTEVFVPIRSITDVAGQLSPPDTRRLSLLATTVMNLTHHFWRTTLDRGMPFLKVELLRDNPVAVDLDGWEDHVDGACDVTTIRTHLQRVQRGGTP